MADFLVEARGLHAYYGASHILHSVDIAIGRGESVGLMGRNGMGKTTLLKTLLGLVRARSGEVKVKGVPVTHAPTHRIARMGIAYVPEYRGIFPNLTVHENLVMAARDGADGRRDWDLERALATFPRLAERIGHMGGQLSGGEQQMLTIGRTLMGNPSLLLLDEPVEGVAPVVVQELTRQIKNLKGMGLTILFAEQNMHFAAEVSDRAYVIEKGHIRFHGTMQELAANDEVKSKYLMI